MEPTSGFFKFKTTMGMYQCTIGEKLDVVFHAYIAHSMEWTRVDD